MLQTKLLEETTDGMGGRKAKFSIASNAVSPAFMQTGFTKDVDDRVVTQIKKRLHILCTAYYKCSS